MMKFYAHESCGWCIPCREGTAWLKKILARLDEGVGHVEGYRYGGRAGAGHVRAHVLRAGRCRGDADHELSWRSSATSSRRSIVLPARSVPAPETQPLVVICRGRAWRTWSHSRSTASRLQVAAGHARHRSGQEARHRDSGVLLLRRLLAAGRVPHVSGGSGEDAQAAAGVHAAGGRGHGCPHRDARRWWRRARRRSNSC